MTGSKTLRQNTEKVCFGFTCTRCHARKELVEVDCASKQHHHRVNATLKCDEHDELAHLQAWGGSQGTAFVCQDGSAQVPNDDCDGEERYLRG